jgi:hypothetical protein
MSDVWPFVLLFLAGVAVCLVLGRVIVRVWGLPLREALIYFGLLPHPDETQLPPTPTRRELVKRRRRAERRIERGQARKPPTPPAARR